MQIMQGGQAKILTDNDIRFRWGTACHERHGSVISLLNWGGKFFVDKSVPVNMDVLSIFALSVMERFNVVSSLFLAQSVRDLFINSVDYRNQVPVKSPLKRRSQQHK